jgi:hypothetical protein
MAWICGYNTWLTIHNIMGLTCLGGGEYFYFILLVFHFRVILNSTFFFWFNFESMKHFGLICM